MLAASTSTCRSAFYTTEQIPWYLTWCWLLGIAPLQNLPNLSTACVRSSEDVKQGAIMSMDVRIVRISC